MLFPLDTGVISQLLLGGKKATMANFVSSVVHRGGANNTMLNSRLHLASNKAAFLKASFIY